MVESARSIKTISVRLFTLHVSVQSIRLHIRPLENTHQREIILSSFQAIKHVCFFVARAKLKECRVTQTKVRFVRRVVFSVQDVINSQNDMVYAISPGNILEGAKTNFKRQKPMVWAAISCDVSNSPFLFIEQRNENE